MSKTQPIPPDSNRCMSDRKIPAWRSDATIETPINNEPVMIAHSIHRPGLVAFEMWLSPSDALQISNQLRTAAEQALEYEKQLKEYKEI